MCKLLFAILVYIFLVTCKNKEKSVQPISDIKNVEQQVSSTNNDSIKIKATDYIFLSDSIFHGEKEILKYYLAKYSSDSCDALLYDKADLKRNFEGILKLGNIRSNKSSSVFVLNPINYCKFDDEESFDGQAYYFTDTTLPRLQTESYCCHPSNIFLVGDIDEDGVTEIGQYFSSCSSHYKTLFVWTFKNNRWHQVGASVFDQRYMSYGKPFSSYIRKIRKNKFEMLEITDLTDDKAKIGKENWKKFSL